MRICTKCGKEKEDFMFGCCKNRPDGIKSQCQECCNKDSLKRDDHLGLYGISKQEVLLKIAKQENKCKICNSTFTKSNWACLDHNHITFVIRDVICRKCNLALGNLNDDYKLAERVMEYLKRWKDTKPALKYLFKV